MFTRYVEYWPGLWTAPEADEILQQLMTETNWQQPTIQLFGKHHLLPRLTAWFGDEGAAYEYSGIRHSPQPWTALLSDIKQRAEDKTGQQYNSVLLNLYRHGQDSNGWHADDEPELCSQAAIASVSLGATRRFRMRVKALRKQTEAWELESGSLLLMRPGAQQQLEHCLPKTSRSVSPRINLTFRKINC